MSVPEEAKRRACAPSCVPRAARARCAGVPAASSTLRATGHPSQPSHPLPAPVHNNSVRPWCRSECVHSVKPHTHTHTRARAHTVRAACVVIRSTSRTLLHNDRDNCKRPQVRRRTGASARRGPRRGLPSGCGRVVRLFSSAAFAVAAASAFWTSARSAACAAWEL